MMDENMPFYALYERDYIKRLEFARDNGCNTMMITGDCEPQQNRSFLQRLGTMNNNLPKPFRWIEIQTTGVLIDEPYLRFLRDHVGISTISVSLSSFDDAINASYNGTPKKHMVNLVELCKRIKKYDFNLRLSVNLTDEFDRYAKNPKEFFRICKETYGADQVTLRVLYESGENVEQAKWVKEHAAKKETFYSLSRHVEFVGRQLEVLEFGRMKYSLNGISVVIDDDCMSGVAKLELKYVILRPNCKLYSKWDDVGSLIF
jgi:hypothetical protein